MILKRLFFLKGTYRGKQKKSLSDDFGAAMLVGDRMKDGTICFDVDLEKNVALFAPKGIFGGEATFDRQGEIPVQECGLLHLLNQLGSGVVLHLSLRSEYSTSLEIRTFVPVFATLNP